MTHRDRWHRIASTSAALVALSLLLFALGGPALAKKPVKPPPPPPTPVDGGTIYFAQGGTLRAMNPDGSGNVSLPPSIAYWAEPSTYTHGGRWFLHVQAVPGATYPTVPALPQLELFAVHESGTPRVQLTDGRIDASTFVEPNNIGGFVGETDCVVRWTAADALVSYTALLTTYDAEGNRTVQDGGIYVVGVDPEGLPGHIATPMSGPPALPLTLSQAGTKVLARSYDWHPDGSAIVFPNHHDDAPNLGVWIAWASDGFAVPTRLMEHGTGLRWSPDGSRILFQYEGIRSIRTDGTDERLLIADPADTKRTSKTVEWASWSPSGTHIAYGSKQYTVRKGTVVLDVFRATGGGVDSTKLTSGNLPKWRE